MREYTKSVVPRGRRGVDGSAAAAAAAKIPLDVACRAHLRRWTHLEHDYLDADPGTRAEMRDIVGGVCSLCPALEQCAIWAVEDKYTGFAAGTWFFAGRPRRQRATRVSGA